MSSTLSNENTKLLITATAAAVAGAAIGIGALKIFEKHEEQQFQNPHQYYDTHGIPKRPSSVKIIDDRNKDLELDESNNNSKTLLFPHNHEEKMRRRIAARVAVEEDNNLPRDSVTVRVPATSANMGPGCTLTCYCIIF